MVMVVIPSSFPTGAVGSIEIDLWEHSCERHRPTKQVDLSVVRGVLAQSTEVGISQRNTDTDWGNRAVRTIWSNGNYLKN